MENTEAPKKNIKDVLKEKDLVVVKRNEIENKVLSQSVATEVFDPVAWAQFREMAMAFIKSGAMPANSNPEKLMVKMQAGHEMGMKPFEAIRSLYIVNGLIALGGRDCIRLLRNHGWNIKYQDETETDIIATVSKGFESYTDSFSYQQAVDSGWATADKPGWKKGANRNLKMRYAVISKIVKSYIPEVMGSAVDIMEVAEDTIPVISGKPVQEAISAEDIELMTGAQSFAELAEVTKSLQGKYKTRVLEPVYNACKEELTE